MEVAVPLESNNALVVSKVVIAHDLLILETFKSYDRYGQPMDYTIGDYADFLNNNPEDFFDESDVVTDSDEFKPGFFDEDDDEFFETLDEESEYHYDEFERRHSINRIEKQPPVEIISNTKKKLSPSYIYLFF